MANESNAQGTITLIGNWTDETADTLAVILDCCAAWYYRLECVHKPTPQSRKVSFTGVGRYDFSTNLSQLQPWLLNWAKERNLSSLPTQVEQLLRLMEQQDLKLLFDFEDEDGEEFFDHEVGLMSAQKGHLLYGMVSRSRASSAKKKLDRRELVLRGAGRRGHSTRRRKKIGGRRLFGAHGSDSGHVTEYPDRDWQHGVFVL